MPFAVCNFTTSKVNTKSKNLIFTKMPGECFVKPGHLQLPTLSQKNVNVSSTPGGKETRRTSMKDKTRERDQRNIPVYDSNDDDNEDASPPKLSTSPPLALPSIDESRLEIFKLLDGDSDTTAKPAAKRVDEAVDTSETSQEAQTASASESNKEALTTVTTTETSRGVLVPSAAATHAVRYDARNPFVDQTELKLPEQHYADTEFNTFSDLVKKRFSEDEFITRLRVFENIAEQYERNKEELARIQQAFMQESLQNETLAERIHVLTETRVPRSELEAKELENRRLQAQVNELQEMLKEAEKCIEELTALVE